MATFTRRCIVNWGTTGASVTVTVYDGSNTSRAGPTAGTEHPASSGIYYADVTWDNSWTSPRPVWTDGTYYAVEDMPVANVTQGNGAAVSPGTGDGSASETTLQKLLRIAQANNPFARN